MKKILDIVFSKNYELGSRIQSRRLELVLNGAVIAKSSKISKQEYYAIEQNLIDIELCVLMNICTELQMDCVDLICDVVLANKSSQHTMQTICSTTALLSSINQRLLDHHKQSAAIAEELNTYARARKISVWSEGCT